MYHTLFHRYSPCTNQMFSVTAPKMPRSDWRSDGIPAGGEMIIISSFGNLVDPSVQCVPKQFHQAANHSVSESEIPHKELDLVLDKARGIEKYRVMHVCQDLPGMQVSRHYYLDKIKQLLRECSAPSGTSNLISSSCVFVSKRCMYCSFSRNSAK